MITQTHSHTDQPARLVWLMRALLAAMLAFGTEILLWNDPPGNDPGQWLLKAVTYLVLACLMLDLVARFRVRDLYGLMLVVAIYALLAGLLINPTFAHTTFPNTLITRVIGGNGTFGLFAVGLLLAFTDGTNIRYRRLFLGYSVWLGFYWGVWVRWTPVLTNRGDTLVSQQTMLVYGGVFIGLIVLLFLALRLTTRSPEQASVDDMTLSIIGWGAAVTTLIIVLMIRALDNAVEIGPLLGSAALILLSWGILWSQRQEKGRTLLDKHLPPKPLTLAWVGLSIVLFTAMTTLGYDRPLLDIDGYGQYSVMELLFTVVGFTWFPLVASVMSVRSIDQRSRVSPGY